MSAEHPGRARSTYRRLRAASGAVDLDLLDERIEVVAEYAAENAALARSLHGVLAQLEASLVPLLEHRCAPAAPETVNHDIAPEPTGQ